MHFIKLCVAVIIIPDFVVDKTTPILQLLYNIFPVCRLQSAIRSHAALELAAPIQVGRRVF